MIGAGTRFREWYARNCWREPWARAEWTEAFLHWWGGAEIDEATIADVERIMEADRSAVLQDLGEWNRRWRRATRTEARN